MDHGARDQGHIHLFRSTGLDLQVWILTRLETSGSCHQTVLASPTELIKQKETTAIGLCRSQRRHCPLLDDLDDILSPGLTVHLDHGIYDGTTARVLHRTGELSTQFQYEVYFCTASGDVALLHR